MRRLLSYGSTAHAQNRVIIVDASLLPLLAPSCRARRDCAIPSSVATRPTSPFRPECASTAMSS